MTSLKKNEHGDDVKLANFSHDRINGSLAKVTDVDLLNVHKARTINSRKDLKNFILKIDFLYKIGCTRADDKISVF